MWCEVLIDDKMIDRGAQMISAMLRAAPESVHVLPSSIYRGDCDLLMTYGTGHMTRRKWWAQHRKSGRHCIGLDLGYWNRTTADPESHSMRFTIDADHPQKWIRPEDPERFDSAGITLRRDYNPAGPILLVGLGWKTARALGYLPQQWERAKLKELRNLYPGRQIVWRPKLARDGNLDGLKTAVGRIEDVLKNCSLVVCRHSNVAVDACIAGVPVICEDGAAFALYKSEPDPSHDARLEFLRSLAHWNYTPKEAKTAWTYLLNRLSV